MLVSFIQYKEKTSRFSETECVPKWKMSDTSVEDLFAAK